MIVKEPRFNIGDKVYHVVDKDSEGVITNIVYYYSTGRHDYIVSMGFGDVTQCTEGELTTEKIY